MPIIRYFAYGSNMLTARLRARCSSARAMGVAWADDYAVAFCKKSRDGSGKATLCPEAGHRLFGVVFELDQSELPALDQAEGAGDGYDQRADFRVQLTGSHEAVTAVIYVAAPDCIDRRLKPYDWYLRLLVAGGQEHKLPKHYLDELGNVPSIPDPKPNRKTRIAALKLLGEQP